MRNNSYNYSHSIIVIDINIYLIYVYVHYSITRNYYSGGPGCAEPRTSRAQRHPPS